MWVAGNFERPGVVAGFTLIPASGLSPLLTDGVLFAQGTMYRPGAATTLPALPASSRRWIWYHSSTGFYLTSTFAPTVADDAFIGWAVTNASDVILVSSQWIGTPPPSGTGSGGTGTGGGETLGGSGPWKITFNWGRGAPQPIGWDIAGHVPVLRAGKLIRASANCAIPGAALPLLIGLRYSTDYVHFASVLTGALTIPVGCVTECQQAVVDLQVNLGGCFCMDLFSGSDEGSQLGTATLWFQ
jgi:hypothetical protein